MKEPIEITYTKTAGLNEQRQDCIAQTIYDVFLDTLADFVDDVDAIPGNTLRNVFAQIIKDMLEDEEFWGD